jgi:uncharacterized membrane protein YkvA (DUF1232 family)
MLNWLKFSRLKLLREIRLYALIIKDPRTPRLAKILLGLAVFYALSPFDLIPDFIPVIGHLDDMILVPAIVFIALKLVPKEIIENYKTKVQDS